MPHYQHIRRNFSYADKSILKGGTTMVWPEFVTSEGEILPEYEPMPVHGSADMFIIIPASRSLRAQHIEFGVRSYFHEGCAIGVCEVVAVLGIHENLKS